MTKTWTATVTVSLGTVSAEQFAKYPEHYGYFFKNFNNPTAEELQNYFEKMQENLGTSNSGSEKILNAPMVMVTNEV